MVEITLQQTPNQSFSFDLDGKTYDVTLRTTETIIADISIDNELAISGVRVMPYRPMIPYEYLAKGGGNLFFITENGDALNYELFGVSQYLAYLTQEEVEFLNAY